MSENSQDKLKSDEKPEKKTTKQKLMTTLGKFVYFFI